MSTGTTVVIAFLGAVVLTALGEVALRLVAGRLHPLTEWQNWEMDHKFQALSRVASGGGASIVAVGSSMVNAGIDPYRLTAALPVRRPAFNASLNGAGTRVLEPWMLEVVMPRLRPAVVVIGLGSHEVSSGNQISKRLHTSLVTSRAWRDLRHDTTRGGRVIAWLDHRSFLFRYRRYLGRKKLFEDTPTRRYSTCRGLGMLRQLLLFRYRSYKIDDHQLVVWKQLVADFDVGDEEMAALKRLVEGIRGMGAVPVLARMPVTEDWIQLHPRGREDFDSFQIALSNFAAEHEIPLIEPVASVSVEDHADPVHLNGQGMERFTDVVADVIRNVTESRSG